DDPPGRSPRVLLLVGVLVVGLFVGGGTLLGNYLGRHSGKPPQAAPASPGRSGRQAPPPAQPSSSPPAQPGTVTYEAEDPVNTVAGGAFVADYAGASGGRIVKNVGAWGSPSGTGRLTFTGVQVAAAGQYAVKVFYVHVN